MKTRLLSTLDRNPGESDLDYVQRIIVDQMTPRDATDDEVFQICDRSVKLSIIREQRSRMLALTEALALAESIDWTETVYDLIRAALVDYELALCKRGRCSHDVCKSPLLVQLQTEHNVTLELVDGEKFVSAPRQIPNEVRSWIVERRASIVSELKWRAHRRAIEE